MYFILVPDPPLHILIFELIRGWHILIKLPFLGTFLGGTALTKKKLEKIYADVQSNLLKRALNREDISLKRAHNLYFL